MTEALTTNVDGASSFGLISFNSAEVVPGIVNGTYFLVVSGEAPCSNMQVSLSPYIYIRCPEYWGIQVIGTVAGGHCLTAIKPFSVSIPLAGVTGSKGIEVLGANGKSERFEVKGGCSE